MSGIFLWLGLFLIVGGNTVLQALGLKGENIIPLVGAVIMLIGVVLLIVRR